MPVCEETLLTHSASDDSLFDDLKHVVSAPVPLLSHLVGSRTKEDREELKRILTHLPVIREVRNNRSYQKSLGPPEAPNVLKVADAPNAPKEATPRGTPRASGTPRNSATPRSPNGGVGAAAYVPPAARSPGVPGTPRGTTPRAAATPRGTTPRGTPPGILGAAAATPRGATPRQSRGNTPRLAGASVVGALLQDDGPPSSAAEKAAAATKKAMEFRGDKKARCPEEEKKQQAEATQRVIEKLAELGIDPEGMSASDILRIFYARGSGSSYWLANREAEKRLNIRASTPKSFEDVLQGRASREIRRARDLPVTNVHEYLDQWEIAFLGDICRSLRCFDEAAEGNSSEYMGKYTKRQYGCTSGRKKYVRPVT